MGLGDIDVPGEPDDDATEAYRDEDIIAACREADDLPPKFLMDGLTPERLALNPNAPRERHRLPARRDRRG